jgi:preprotein translocase subunit SecG
MYQLLIIISIIVCVLLVLIVLIQNPKGGGLSSNFSSSSQLMGVQKTGDILEKGTWGLAIFLMVLALAINVSVKGGVETSTKQNKFIPGLQKGHTAAPTQTPAAQPAPQSVGTGKTGTQAQPLTPVKPAK